MMKEDVLSEFIKILRNQRKELHYTQESRNIIPTS